MVGSSADILVEAPEKNREVNAGHPTGLVGRSSKMPSGPTSEANPPVRIIEGEDGLPGSGYPAPRLFSHRAAVAGKDATSRTRLRHRHEANRAHRDGKASDARRRSPDRHLSARTPL